jgi:hypothetical protein
VLERLAPQQPQLLVVHGERDQQSWQNSLALRTRTPLTRLRRNALSHLTVRRQLYARLAPNARKEIASIGGGPFKTQYAAVFFSE